MEKIYACEETALIDYLEAVLSISDRNVEAADLGPVEFPVIFEETEEGENATIEISGVLSRTGPPPIAQLFGIQGTAYNDIIKALDMIGQREKIRNVKILMNTPGGEVSGLDEVWQAVRNLGQKKNITVVNTGLLASAGYWIASAADTIEASSPVNLTGSIGVVIAQINNREMLEKHGIKRVEIISRNAPDKRPDGTTKRGRAVLQEEADAIERVFIGRIAEGRGIEAAKVKKDFGQGRVMVAWDPEKGKESAIKAGMIDRVALGHNRVIEAGEGMPAVMKALINAADQEEAEMSAGATSFKDYPIADRPWDATAADRRMRQATGSADKPSASYKNGFFWYDSENAENFTAYKLPFVDIVDGRPHAIRRGVFAANGAMKGARGGVQIPAGDRTAVQSHIDKYLQKINKQDQQKQTKGECEKMTLQEVIKENPELGKEIEDLRAEAHKAGREELQKTINQALNYVESEKYNDSIKDMGFDVIKGNMDLPSLLGAVAFYDRTQAQKDVQEAAEDSEGIRPVPPQNAEPTGSDPGEINTEEDHLAEVIRFKKEVQGIRPTE